MTTAIKILTQLKKNPLTRKALVKTPGSRKCYFAMTQAFLGQADSTGAL
jgi:hypothetical protein